jgi:hypothetical protein
MTLCISVSMSSYTSVSNKLLSCDITSPYLNQINFLERLVISGLLNIQDGDDVFMIEVSKKLHFSQCSQTEHGVVEGCDLLDGYLLA